MSSEPVIKRPKLKQSVLSFACVGLQPKNVKAVKRLMKEAQELREPTEQFFAQPLDDNLFEWHFTIRGPADSEFEGGIYHGRIVLPPEYPMKPPSIILLTPNGRFETNKKICLSISGHHPESWQPSWSLRTALLAIIGFMPTHGNGAIGSLDYTADERKALAKRSLDWKCPQCGAVHRLLLPVTEASKALNREAKELGSQINLQGEKEKSAASPDAGSTGASTVTEDQASGAAGPVPSSSSSETLPSFPAPPFPMNPQLMFGGAARFPNAMGGFPFNPMMPMPPFFFPPNMMYNPLMMQPRPLSPFPTAPLTGFPPGFPMPGWWMNPSQFPQFGASTGVPNQMGSSPMSSMVGQSGAMPGFTGAAPGTLGAMPSTSGAAPGISSAVSGTLGAMPGTSAAVPGTSGAVLGTSRAAPDTSGAASGTSGAASGTMNAPSSASVAAAGPSDVTAPGSSTTSSAVPKAVSSPSPSQQTTLEQSTPSSSSVPSTTVQKPPVQPSTSESNTAAPSASATAQSLPSPAAAVRDLSAGLPSVVPDDPVPSASELRQRSAVREQRAPPLVQRTNLPAELPRHQRSLSSNIGRFLLNFLVGVLILCIIALLSRRLYLLG